MRRTSAHDWRRTEATCSEPKPRTLMSPICSMWSPLLSLPSYNANDLLYRLQKSFKHFYDIAKIFLVYWENGIFRGQIIAKYSNFDFQILWLVYSLNQLLLIVGMWKILWHLSRNTKKSESVLFFGTRNENLVPASLGWWLTYSPTPTALYRP